MLIAGYGAHNFGYSVINHMGHNIGKLSFAALAPNSSDGSADLPLHGLAPGLYFVNFHIDGQGFTRKVVIQ